MFLKKGVLDTKRLEAFYDDGNYLAGKSTTIILESPKIETYFVLALLNSELVSFWYKIYFQSLSLVGGYLRINSNEIKKIPVCELKDHLYKQIISMVQEVLPITGSEDYFDNPKKEAGSPRANKTNRSASLPTLRSYTRRNCDCGGR